MVSVICRAGIERARWAAVGCWLALVLVLVLAASVSRADLPAEIRIITYNIHHGEGLDGKTDLARIAQVLTAEKPHLVALQEVDDKTRRSRGVDQPAELARLTKMEVVFGRNIDFQGGGYGTAVLTSLPVRSSRNVKLKSFYAPTKTNPEQRGVQIITLGSDKPELIFFCTHLDYRPPDDERFNSALTINRLAKELAPVPAILAGDLNATPDSRVLREFARRWKIVGPQTGTSTGADAGQRESSSHLTFPADNPKTWIDYVLYRPTDGWRVVESRTLEEPVASDHRPLLAVLRRLP